MTTPAAADNARHCFVCGPDNPLGMRIAFRIENGVCRGEFTPPAHLCGFDGVTHGGVLFSLLDDVMANWLFLQGEPAYTGKCEIRYRQPAAIGERLLLEGELLSRKGRVAQLRGTLTRARDAAVVAEATATFFVQSAGAD
ncbi:MAG: PaaI family thioesterase [Gammaproteobacteria bacterium]|nr:PaaI family thioesterase [Gammaproteobacteria bacterium]